MSPLVLSYFTTAAPENFSTRKAQEKDLKINFIKMIEACIKKTNKSLKEI